MHYTYKQVQKDDCSFLEKLFKVEEYHPIFFENETTEDMWLQRYDQIKSFQIIYDKSEPIGVVDIKNKEDHIFLRLLALLQTKRNKHHGTNILEDIKHAHNKKIVVDVMESNQKAIAFYENNGFIQIGTKIEDYEKNGMHKYIIYEQITIVPYQESSYVDLLSIRVDEASIKFVSTSENILYKHLKNKSNTKLLLFYLKGNIIGCVLIRQNDEFNNFFIWQLLIDQSYQNNKIGFVATKQIIKKLKCEYNTYSILTTVLNDNTRSKHFFTKLGFLLHSTDIKGKETNYIL
jgi:ribosomal protein S18 acetylase RimI-like enzyme